MALTVLGPSTRPGVIPTILEDPIVDELDQPCKNVDLQTRARWASSRPPWSAEASGYRPVSLIGDVPVAAGLQNALDPAATPGGGCGTTGGWFFSIPPVPQQPPALDSRRMMQSIDAPFGSVINLNRVQILRDDDFFP